jgi:hypothetical protein
MGMLSFAAGGGAHQAVICIYGTPRQFPAVGGSSSFTPFRRITSGQLPLLLPLHLDYMGAVH